MENKILCIVFFGLINVCVITAFSQTFSSEVWHDGQVVLLDGDTLRGEVMYSMENQTVQLNDGKTIRAFSPRKLVSFEIMDKVLDFRRVFYILPYALKNNYEAPYIFELTYEGRHISMLRTEEIASVARNSSYMYASFTVEELQHTYYFINRRGRIREFSGKRNELLDILGDHENDIRAFIEANNLNLGRLDHLIKVCDYYNSLFNL